jgi:hypothetical protein
MHGFRYEPGKSTVGETDPVGYSGLQSQLVVQPVGFEVGAQGYVKLDDPQFCSSTRQKSDAAGWIKERQDVLEKRIAAQHFCGIARGQVIPIAVGQSSFQLFERAGAEKHIPNTRLTDDQSATPGSRPCFWAWSQEARNASQSGSQYLGKSA